KEKFLRGLIAWLGFPSTTVEYVPNHRIHGATKFSRKHLLNMALTGITAFSTMPLRMLTRLGVFFLIPSTLYIFYAIGLVMYAYFTHQHDFIPPGWATLA